MNIFARYKSDFRQNLKLAMPIMAGQLGQVAVNLADNIMVGKLGASALAGVSFANAMWAIPFVFGIGISFALPPLISEADGAKDDRHVSSYFKHSLIINIGYGLISMILLLLTIPLMSHMGQEVDILPHAKSYLFYSAFSMIPLMIFQTLRCYSDGMSETIPPMIVIIGGNLMNVVLNYALIFGHWGFPSMGVAGASLSSLISRICMVFALMGILFYWKDLWKYLRSIRIFEYQKVQFKKILNLGIPSSLQMTFEVTAFSIAAIIMGLLSKDAMAAHQIAISIASISFMVCTGLAMAGTIRVGNQLGQKNIPKLRDVGSSILIQMILFMAISASLFIIFRHAIPNLYIQDANVISITSGLLLLAAVFQISDGVQVASLSLLRGIQDVKTPTIVTFISYWVIGIPFSYITAIHFGWGPKGVWIGLIIGLTLAAILLSRRFYRLTHKMLTKDNLDASKD